MSNIHNGPELHWHHKNKMKTNEQTNAEVEQMSGICSAHTGFVQGCIQCEALPKAQTEKICKWMGCSWDRVTGALLLNGEKVIWRGVIIPNWTTRNEWLSSDSGTVAMILKIGESRQFDRIVIIQSGGEWIVRIMDWYRDAESIDTEAQEKTLNLSLQAAILELIGEK